MRRQNPQGIEPYLRDLRVHLLYSVGLQGCVEDLSAPYASLAARKDQGALLDGRCQKLDGRWKMLEVFVIASSSITI